MDASEWLVSHSGRFTPVEKTQRYALERRFGEPNSLSQYCGHNRARVSAGIRTSVFPSFDPIRSLLKPIHNPHFYFLNNKNFYAILQSTPGSVRFRTEILYESLVLPTRAICSTHLIFLGLITIIVVGEEYKLWSCTLCHFMCVLFLT